MTKTRVAIIGAGASGMSAAHALSRHQERFEVYVFESSATLGGMATSAPVVPAPHGPSTLSDGVEDSSALFHNTYKIFRELGLSKSECNMQLGFEQAAERDNWELMFPKETVEAFRVDIEKFGRALETVKKLEPLYAVISIRAVLHLFRFSPEFGDRLLYPLLSMFFGTAHQTPYLSSVIVERLFTDPSMRLFEYSRKSFLDSCPSLRAFPHLDHVYQTWSERLEATGVVHIRTSREVTHVVRESSVTGGVRLWHRAVGSVSEDVADSREKEELFDELIMATDAKSALNILGGDANWLERKILGNVGHLWDVAAHPKNEKSDKVGR